MKSIGRPRLKFAETSGNITIQKNAASYKINHLLPTATHHAVKFLVLRTIRALRCLVLQQLEPLVQGEVEALQHLLGRLVRPEGVLQRAGATLGPGGGRVVRVAAPQLRQDQRRHPSCVPGDQRRGGVLR